MINKVVNILKNRIRSREKLNEVTDGLANTCRDDAENHECNQKSKRAYELERVDIGHVNTCTYKGAEYNELYIIVSKLLRANPDISTNQYLHPSQFLSDRGRPSQYTFQSRDSYNSHRNCPVPGTSSLEAIALLG